MEVLGRGIQPAFRVYLQAGNCVLSQVGAPDADGDRANQQHGRKQSHR
jgi:hypothetical protein